MKTTVKWLISGLICCILAGCAQHSPAQIAATTMPVYQFTSYLCQDTPLRVQRLITEEVSCVHDYTLTVGQMRAIEGAELVILSGAGLEEFMEEALHGAENAVDCSVGIPLLEGECHHHHEEEGDAEDAHGHEPGHNHETDPHIWLDPENARIMVSNIYEALVRQYPEHITVFQENLMDLNQELSELEAYGRDTLLELKSREIITFHDGFGYLANAFDLEILEAIEEESGSEPSAQELIGLIEMVRKHDVAAIFVERSGSSAAAGVISAETGVPVYTLDMAMAGDDWFQAMYHNINTLKEALG